MFGSAVPEPLGVQISRWRQDPFALGAYSFKAVGTRAKDRKALFGPDWENRLLFAGEATSGDYPATVHGALLTGRAAARSLLGSTERDRQG
jgi:monoamine oxidase